MNRVLIIEDDAVARRQLAQLFRFEEFEVTEAESGEAGIEAAASAAPDLVVCDIMMPGTDGFGVLEALRKSSPTALTPFIFLTAKAGGQDVRQGMSRGADDYITKPFDPETLLASARRRLTRRQAQIKEAEQRAADTGMQAAAALPRELEGCLAQIESITEAFAARYHTDPQSEGLRNALKTQIGRLRTLSQRLRLYGDLPRLYAQRFSAPSPVITESAHEIAADAARGVARQWARIDDLQITAQPGAVPVPEDSLSVLVTELVDNACKFSAPSTPILIEAKTEEAFWRLQVSDRGRGMMQRQIQQIGAFKQFWQGTERPAGLGIGLVLVQTIVRLYSGEVLIESEPQEGTRVTVLLPSD